MSYLQTADKFINTAQQITPMVKQWAPMLQNVPALLRLYRGFSAAPAAGAAASAATAATAAATATTATSAAAPAAARVANTVASTGGVSLPRIFQPPF